jgi:hypothetical protein
MYGGTCCNSHKADHLQSPRHLHKTSPNIKNDELHVAIYFLVLQVMTQRGCLEVWYQCFKETWFLHLWGSREDGDNMFFQILASIFQTTQYHNNVENHSLNLQHHEYLNLKAEIIFLIFAHITYLLLSRLLSENVKIKMTINIISVADLFEYLYLSLTFREEHRLSREEYFNSNWIKLYNVTVFYLCTPHSLSVTFSCYLCSASW